MDSEEELLESKVVRRLPKRLPKLPKSKERKIHRRKANQISSSGDESLSNSIRSEQTSIEMDVFMVRSKPLRERTIQSVTEDEIHNQNTSDDLRTPTSDETISKSQKIPEYVTQTSTDSRSYRDKLKERFRSVKQLSSQNLEKSSLKKFKSKSQDVINLNKCIENLRQDNQLVNAQLKVHQPYVYQGGSDEASSAEKYQFFCESLPEGSSNPPETQDEETAEAGEKAAEPDVVEKRAESLKELLVKSYEELTWSPGYGNLVIKIEPQELQETEETINIMEPNLPKRHLSQLKQRLIASDNKEFFNASGNIKYNKSSYSKLSYRPDRFDIDSPIQLIFRKASATIPDSMSTIIISESTPTLEINIQAFRFTNHPLFSAEHSLQEELIRLIDIHKEFRRANKRDTLWERLQSLRRAKISLSETAGDATQDLQASNALLLKQVKQLREEFYEECKRYRDNAKSVLNEWKALKKLRKDNGYSTTTIKVAINKHPDGFFDDPELVLQELSEETAEEYQQKLTAYERELQIWREHLEDNESSAEDKPAKPPRLISAKKLRTLVDAMMRDAFGAKDEPIISFAVNYSHGITPLARVNEEEKNRRHAVENTKMYLNLSLNNVHICKSKQRKLKSTFTLNFDEVLSIRLMEHENVDQEKIEVQLVEVHRMSKRILCVGCISIPKFELLQGQSEFQEVSFKTDDVTAGICGCLTFCISWDSTQGIVSSQQHLKSQELQNSTGTNSPQVQRIFTEKENQNGDQISKFAGKHFRLDPYLESFTIGTREEIENNIRLQLLKLRDNNEPEFVGMMIPNRLKEIPSNIFSTYKRRLADEKYQEYFDQEDDTDDDVVGKRSLGRKYLRQIHTKIFQICRNCKNNLCFEDVVDEKMVPWIQNYLKSMLSNIINWFKLKPALNKPLPTLTLRSEEDAEQNMTSGGLINGCKIIIKLKSAINLPTPTTVHNVAKMGKQLKNKRTKRNNSRSNTPERASNAVTQGGSYFVEVHHENSAVISGLSQGKDPSWNEMLSITLHSENVDYINPNSLSGSISIRLFQQQIDEEHESITSAYIGNVDILISAVVSDNKLEGEFPLKSPPFIYGYEKEEETRSPSTPRIQANRNLSFLEMSLYADTTIPKISADLSSIVCGEPPFIRDHVLEWNKRFNVDHPRRKFNALAIDSNGRTICLTRFIKPLEPPKLNADEFDVSLEQCARFVSLVPFSKVNKFYENVWLSAEQVLKLGIGSPYDHATLLTCYLLSLQMEVWLLLGYGIPHGNTAYVLLREYNDTPLPTHFVIDVTSGNKFNITDQYCPLKKVYCVLNEHNIWANIQRGDAVFTTRFDFTRRFDWQALFNNTVSAPSSSVQQNLHYLQCGDVQKLQSTIEKRLAKKIAKQRTQEVTIWNHQFANLLTAQINKAETNFMHGKTHLTSTESIIEYSNNCKINGSIQCLHFSSVSEVVDEILRTKTWDVNDSNVEFATCVRVHAYVNRVIAVWVAFVSIVKQ